MEVLVLQQGQNARGHWTLLQAEHEGYICTAFATTTKALVPNKDKKVTIPTSIYSKLDWKF